MKLIYLLIFSVWIFQIKSQSATPSVFNAGGDTRTVNIGSQQVFFTDNIGEAFIHAPSDTFRILTQGFLQPTLVQNQTSVTIRYSHVSCKDKGDGQIIAELQHVPAGAVIIYSWTPTANCPTLSCDKLENLSAGNFSLTVIITPTTGGATPMIFNFAVTINDSNEPCRVKVYTGITIGGNNPSFYIENIEEFPNNKVIIFNRWGRELFSTNAYNNQDNYWPPKDVGEKITPGTYFYIIDLGDGSKLMKGWIEILN